MNWVLYWFLVFLIELFLMAYIVFLDWEIKQLKRKPIKFKITRTVTEERTKKEIVRG
jgi:di/tricarboxylate transporter